jgi:glycosyltransferase involved in cell wall biosynthesis
MIDTPDGGYLIQPNDTDGYVAALKELSADPNLASKIGAHSKNKARALYAYKDVIARWRDLYASIS